MLAALRAKFEDPSLPALLFETGTRTIGEDSPYDHEWGMRDRRGGYGGQNLLGLALMQVR